MCLNRFEIYSETYKEDMCGWDCAQMSLSLPGYTKCHRLQLGHGRGLKPPGLVLSCWQGARPLHSPPHLPFLAWVPRCASLPQLPFPVLLKTTLACGLFGHIVVPKGVCDLQTDWLAL